MGPGTSTLPSVTRKNVEASPPLAALDRSRPTTFFLASEEMVDRTEPFEAGSDSYFGVQSLQETTLNIGDGGMAKHGTEGEDAQEGESEGTSRRSTLKPRAKPREKASQLFGATSPPSTANSSPRKLPRRSSPPSTSHSLASLSQASQDPCSSSPSSPKSTSNGSFRPSDEESMDEGGSQALASSEDEAEAEAPPEVGNSAPQLIMPSIKMPSRRPFTDRGKAIGRFKILIAGNTGNGTIQNMHLAGIC